MDATTPETTAPADARPEMTTPKARALSLFVGAFNSAYEDEHSMVFTLHMGNGSRLMMAGRLTDYAMDFDTEMLDTFLRWLIKAEADPEAVLTVASDYFGTGYYRGMAWNLNTRIEYLGADAAKWLGSVEAERERTYTLNLTASMDVDVLEHTALTNAGKDVLRRYAEPKPAEGRTFTYSLPAVVHATVTAPDADAARQQIGDLEATDFDLDTVANNGATISYVTVDADAEEAAELLGVDGTPLEEMDDQERPERPLTFGAPGQVTVTVHPATLAAVRTRAASLSEGDWAYMDVVTEPGLNYGHVKVTSSAEVSSVFLVAEPEAAEQNA